MKPLSLHIAAATIKASWYVALSWRIYGPRFVGGMTSQERITEGEAS